MSSIYALQDAFLAKFFTSSFAQDFYLTGGTALARFYFHHRVSIDVDLFTHNQKIDFNDVNMTVIALLRRMNLTLTKQVVTETFLQYIGNDTEEITLKIDIVKDIPVHFGDIKTQEKIRVDSLENIGSNKVLAIFGRTDGKDFIDLYFVLAHTQFSFEHLYQLAKKKDLGLTEFYLANSIANVATITQWPPMEKPFDIKRVVRFYQKLSRKLLLRIKPKT